MDVVESSPQPAPSGRGLLFILSVLAFILRLGAVWATLGLATPPATGSDAHEYDIYAWNVAQGRGYRGPSVDATDSDHLTAYRAPVPALYYAAIYRAFGHHYPVAHAFNALLGALTVLLVFGITRRCFSTKAAWAAAVIYALYPFSIYFGLVLHSEVFSAWLVCLFVWCSLRTTGPHGFAWSLGTGLSFGLLLLSKPGFLFAMPLLPLWAWIVCGRSWNLWRRVLIIPAAAGLVMAPWVARNWVVMHRFIPFGTSGGQLLLCGNNRFVVGDPMLYGYSVMDSSLPEYAPALQAARDEMGRDAAAKQFAIGWLWKNPDKWFYLAQGKFLRLWTPRYAGTQYGAFRLVATTYYGLILALFTVSLVPVAARFVGERHPGLVMLCLIAGTIAVALVFHGQHRYRFPIDSLCICIAAAGLVWTMDALAWRTLGPSLAAIGHRAVSHRVPIALAAAGAVGLSTWWCLDQHQIELYRDRECRSRLEAIGRAVAAYQGDHGQPPIWLGDLVPDYLPNIDGLHCPKHSLKWHDYLKMGNTDARESAFMISYRLEGGRGPVQVVEDHARHFGRRNAIGPDGETRRLAEAMVGPRGIR